MLINDLVVFHRESSLKESATAPSLSVLEAGSWFHWKTCLRELWIGWNTSFADDVSLIDSGFERSEGPVAYQKLLEIICGLKSPLFGETEVFGQFKETSLAFVSPVPFWQLKFEKLFKKILSDAKRVRQLHLTQLGSQSYGSVIRREVKNSSHVHILGSGHLVREMLPWLNKKSSQYPLKIYGRDLNKMQSELQTFPDLVLRTYRDTLNLTSETGVLIIAAPLSAEAIQLWVEAVGLRPQLVIDLRGESAHDPLKLDLPYLDLKEVFSKISMSREKQKEFRLRAQTEIQSLTQKRWSEVEFRPFGWEDLCVL